ncbi:hypothetical protein CBR_g19011 [Chara braunii]|uniref:Uncharacterized protein n=1 Tax=Chara braunii TaxID=69332 RepID=A0A388KXB7_CHABU|nr:hypothetical protein CBR_g19011 [Chara braunii]|eukprot:GBG74603.1 hypothetical protein CBR_g19011 [Chara braunii]
MMNPIRAGARAYHKDGRRGRKRAPAIEYTMDGGKDDETIPRDSKDSKAAGDIEAACRGRVKGVLEENPRPMTTAAAGGIVIRLFNHMRSMIRTINGVRRYDFSVQAHAGSGHQARL